MQNILDVALHFGAQPNGFLPCGSHPPVQLAGNQRRNERTFQPRHGLVQGFGGGPPPGFRGDVADYVLTGFDPVERAQLPDVWAKAADAVETVVTKGIAAAMQGANTKPRK